MLGDFFFNANKALNRKPFRITAMDENQVPVSLLSKDSGSNPTFCDLEMSTAGSEEPSQRTRRKSCLPCRRILSPRVQFLSTWPAVWCPNRGGGGRGMDRAGHGQHQRHTFLCQVKKRPFSTHPEQVKTAMTFSPLTLPPGLIPQGDGKGDWVTAADLKGSVCVFRAGRPRPSPYSVTICPHPIVLGQNKRESAEVPHWRLLLKQKLCVA